MKKILQVRGPLARDILGLLQQVATSEGSLPLHDIHCETLKAMAFHLFQCDFDPGGPTTPLIAAGKVVTDVELRRDVMNMAGILPFLEEKNESERIDAVERLAIAFDFDKHFVKRLRQLCHEAVGGLAMCLYRPLCLEVGLPLWKGPVKLAGSMVHLDGDRHVLKQYESFRELEVGSFGRTLIDYYDDNNFPLPGTRGAFFSNSLTIHDIHHVLAGYPTSPIGETCIIGFDSGVMNLDMGKALIAYVAQFQVGLQFDKGLPRWKNQFRPDTVLRSFERGGGVIVNYLQMEFDFNPYYSRLLSDVRREFGIDPEGALISGPDDSWAGQLGTVGERESDDMIQHKKNLLERLLAGKNTKS